MDHFEIVRSGFALSLMFNPSDDDTHKITITYYQKTDELSLDASIPNDAPVETIRNLLVSAIAESDKPLKEISNG